MEEMNKQEMKDRIAQLEQEIKVLKSAAAIKPGVIKADAIAKYPWYAYMGQMFCNAISEVIRQSCFGYIVVTEYSWGEHIGQICDKKIRDLEVNEITTYKKVLDEVMAVLDKYQSITKSLQNPVRKKEKKL